MDLSETGGPVMSKYFKTPGFIDADALALAGFLAISIVLMQGLLPLGFVDISVTVALIAFAIAIPLLATCIFIDRAFEIPPKAKFYNFSYVTGLLVAPVGIVAAFWHISWYIGVICLLSCLVGFGTFVSIAGLIGKASMEENRQAKGIDPWKQKPRGGSTDS